MEKTIDNKEGNKKIKDRFADAMIELLNEKSISKITVGDICLKADLSRKSFYRTFYDKFDVFAYIFKSYIDDVIESHGIMAMQENATMALNFFCKYRSAIKDMGCDFGHPNPFMNYWFQYSSDYYYKVIGKNRVTTDLKFAMNFYFHATYFTFYEYVSGNISGNPSEVIQITLTFLPDPLKTVLFDK